MLYDMPERDDLIYLYIPLRSFFHILSFFIIITKFNLRPCITTFRGSTKPMDSFRRGFGTVGQISHGYDITSFRAEFLFFYIYTHIMFLKKIDIIYGYITYNETKTYNVTNGFIKT